MNFSRTLYQVGIYFFQNVALRVENSIYEQNSLNVLSWVLQFFKASFLGLKLLNKLDKVFSTIISVCWPHVLIEFYDFK